MNNQNRTLEFLLISIWFLGIMAVNFMLPILPTLAKELHASPTLIKYTISIFLFGKATGMIVYGPLSERYGRRPFVIFGLILFAAGNLMAAGASDITTLLCARLIQGLGTSATVLMGRVMINDLYKQNQAASVFSKLFLIAAIIISFLPTMASFLATHFIWRITFISMFAYSGIILVLNYFFLPETQSDCDPNYNTRAIFKHYQTILKNPVFLGYVLCSIFMVAGESAFNTASSFLLIKTYGISTKVFGWIMTSVAVGHLVGTYICGKIVKTCTLTEMMGIGVVILACSAVGMACAVFLGYDHVLLIVIPMVIFFIGTGFVMTITAVGVVTPFPKLIGTAQAASMMLFFTCSSLSSGIMSNLSTHTAKPVTLLIALYGIGAFCAWYFLIVGKKASAAHRTKGELAPPQKI